MKKVITVIICTAVLMMANEAVAEISFGVKGGFNKTSQSFDFTQFGDLGSLSKTGAEIGIFFEFPLIKSFSLDAEIRYMHKGEQFDFFTWGGNLPNPEPALTGRIAYISFLAVGKLWLPLGGFNVYGIAGPRLDFKVAPAAVVGFEILSNGYESPLSGGVVGAGMEIEFGDDHWILIEGYFGFEVNKAFESNLLKIDNKTVGLLVGIRT